jgi:hypothetical protein
VSDDARDDTGRNTGPDRGVMRVTTSSLRIPDGFTTESSRGMNRVALVVVLLAALFIAFVAWLIHGGQ